MQFEDTLERVGRRYRAGSIYGLVEVLFGDPCGKIAELKAEVTYADKEDKDAARSGRSGATPFRDLSFALMVLPVDEYWR